MFAKRVLAAAACVLAALATTPTDAAKAKDHVQFDIRDGKIASRAVNLGGWLCAEYWMTYTSPLWKDVPENSGWDGEFMVMKNLGEKKGTEAFEAHWSTWITEKDIAEIAKSGLNTVRVSTGYWIINDEDDSDKSEVAQTYAKGGLKYLDKLINKWAVKYNLAVMISLHAHKGSQNGLDHSAPAVMGKITWSDDPDNVKSSLNYATFLANRYKNSPAFLGLNLMNEPMQPTDYDVLKKYYKDAYEAIRADGNDCIIGTSPWLQEQAVGYMMDFMPCPDYYNVWHEFHVYYKWGWEKVTKEFVFSEAAKYGSSHYDGWTGNPVFLGEWSLATADEVPLTDEDFSTFGAIQMKEAEAAPSGWAFWAWRHDDETKKTSGWSMRQLLRKGLIKVPTDLPVRTKAKDSKCPAYTSNRNVTSSSSSSSSGSSNSSSSSSGALDKTSLFTPKKVEAPDTDAVNVTKPVTTTEAPAPSAAHSLTAASAVALVAAASSVCALLL